MRRLRVKLAIGVAVLGVVVTGAVAVAGDHARNEFRTTLTGYEEVPALATSGGGLFRAELSRRSDEIRYQLTFGRLETDATQSHIHFEQQTNNGPIVVFLCSNLGNGPAGTQACPAGGGTIRDTITPADVGPGGAAQGLDAGDFTALVSAMRSGAMYVNVHSVGRPGGEIRGQLDRDSGGHRR